MPGKRTRAERLLEVALDALAKATSRPLMQATQRLSWLLSSSAAGSLRNPVRTRLERRREIDEMKVVIVALIRRIRGVAGRIAERIDAAMRTATRPGLWRGNAKLAT
jgi:hypothetical protein